MTEVLLMHVGAKRFIDTDEWPEPANMMSEPLAVGDVVLATRDDEPSWWLVVGHHPQVGQNSVLVGGRCPRGFTFSADGAVWTHWSDAIIVDQRAVANPPKPWPDDVVTAVALFALTGESR